MLHEETNNENSKEYGFTNFFKDEKSSGRQLLCLRVFCLLKQILFTLECDSTSVVRAIIKEDFIKVKTNFRDPIVFKESGSMSQVQLKFFYIWMNFNWLFRD